MPYFTVTAPCEPHTPCPTPNRWQCTRLWSDVGWRPISESKNAEYVHVWTTYCLNILQPVDEIKSNTESLHYLQREEHFKHFKEHFKRRTLYVTQQARNTGERLPFLFLEMTYVSSVPMTCCWSPSFWVPSLPDEIVETPTFIPEGLESLVACLCTVVIVSCSSLLLSMTIRMVIIIFIEHLEYARTCYKCFTCLISLSSQ